MDSFFVIIYHYYSKALGWLTSPENEKTINLMINILQLIMGMVGCMIAITTLIVGPVLFSRWVKEKRAEKRSSIAEEALNDLDLSVIKFDKWVQYIHFEQADNNLYFKQFDDIMELFNKIKYKARRLSNTSLAQEIDLLELALKSILGGLHHSTYKNEDLELQRNMRHKGPELINSNQLKVKEQYEKIHKILCSFIWFNIKE